MNRDFFISLCLATHRVGNLFNAEVRTPIKLCANAVLSRLILLLEDSLGSTQKKAFAQEILQELESLEKHFQLAKAQALSMNSGQGNINPKNFSILEREYAKVREFAQGFLNEREQEKMSRINLDTSKEGEGPPAGEAGKSLRARKILGLLGSKEKVQVWELQKVLPQVTKRTLRRDLDTLVQQGLLERKGQWNTVFYQMKTGENLGKTIGHFDKLSANK